MRRYARIVRSPRIGRLLAAAILARLPIGVSGLAIVLFLREETGSFAVAGAVAGGLALGTALAAPLLGRLVDRRSARVLVPMAALHALGLGVLIVLGFTGAPAAALIATGTLAGAVFPPTTSVLRTCYPALLRHERELLSSAFALDSILTELVFVGGPLLTAVVVAAMEPAAALALSGAAACLGTLWFVAALPPPEPQGRPTAGRGLLVALRSAGLRTLLLSMLPFGFAFGALEVALPAFADQEGRPELAGVLIAVWALSSAVGGLMYGARPRRADAASDHLRLALLLPLTLLPLAAAPSALTMALLVIPAGVFIAPLLATRNELVGTAAPTGAETESFTWALTSLVGGISLGAAAAGALVDAADWRAAALVAAAVAGLGGLIALGRRSTLEAAAAKG